MTSPNKPPIKYPESPRFECNHIGAQIGLAVAIKRNKYATFVYELLVVIGPFAFVFGVWRRAAS